MLGTGKEDHARKLCSSQSLPTIHQIVNTVLSSLNQKRLTLLVFCFVECSGSRNVSQMQPWEQRLTAHVKFAFGVL